MQIVRALLHCFIACASVCALQLHHTAEIAHQPAWISKDPAEAVALMFNGTASSQSCVWTTHPRTCKPLSTSHASAFALPRPVQDREADSPQDYSDRGDAALDDVFALGLQSSVRVDHRADSTPEASRHLLDEAVDDSPVLGLQRPVLVRPRGRSNRRNLPRAFGVPQNSASLLGLQLSAQTTRRLFPTGD